MSDFSLTLVLRFKTSKKIFNDMAKVSIKSEKITPFGGIFHVRELFSHPTDNPLPETGNLPLSLVPTADPVSL